MSIVEEELDETLYWLELFIECGLLKANEAGTNYEGRQRTFGHCCCLNQKLREKIDEGCYRESCICPSS